MYIADTANQRIRKVTVSTGIITTIAGTGTASYSGDNGQATSANLNYPNGVALDTSGKYEILLFLLVILFICISNLGNVYIADSSNNRIRKVTVSTGIIITIAGTGTGSYSGENGAATSAALKYPSGAVIDSAGIYFLLCFFMMLTYKFLYR